MPVTTRSSTHPATVAATATVPSAHAHSYNLRNVRPSAGFYTEMTSADVAAAETLVSMHSAPAPTRRSARLAQRS
jgi:hypothetical protein